MGCWSATLWDNDECYHMLRTLFVHLGAIPRLTTDVIRFIPCPLGRRIYVRHNADDMNLVLGLFNESLTAKTLARAQELDPSFEAKFLADTVCIVFERVGLTNAVVWTLIRMHVGAPVPVADLDIAAARFAPRNTVGWSTEGDVADSWIFDPFLKLPNGEQPSLALRNSDAAIIRDGIFRYKGWMVAAGDDKEKRKSILKPMRLPFIGPTTSLKLWFSGVRPVESHELWNFDVTKLVEQDTTMEKIDLDTPACAQCGAKTKARSGGEGDTQEKRDEEPLQKCPCGTFYCSKACQRMHWKVHKALHKLRTLGCIDAHGNLIIEGMKTDGAGGYL